MLVERLRKKPAVTLIELIVVMVLIGIVTSGLSLYLVQAIDMWDFMSDRSEVINQLRIGMIRMGRDIRQISVIETASDDSASLQFLKGSSSTQVRIRYRFSGGFIVYDLDEDLDGAFEVSQPLLRGVTAFQFTYYDSTAIAVNAPFAGKLSNIYRIKMNLTVGSGESSEQIMYEVFPRKGKQWI